MNNIIEHLKSLKKGKEQLAQAHLADIERSKQKLASTQNEIEEYTKAIIILELGVKNENV